MLGQEWHQRETSTSCLVEAFHIHSLDLKARPHYASVDSRVVHIAEKVMIYLNPIPPGLFEGASALVGGGGEGAESARGL